MRTKRDAYSAAIDRVRSEHRDTITPAQMKVECPRCRTRQVLPDVPGMRYCVKCGHEFRPLHSGGSTR